MRMDHRAQPSGGDMPLLRSWRMFFARLYRHVAPPELFTAPAASSPSTPILLSEGKFSNFEIQFLCLRSFGFRASHFGFARTGASHFGFFRPPSSFRELA